jgi:hypothetical protein
MVVGERILQYGMWNAAAAVAAAAAADDDDADADGDVPSLVGPVVQYALGLSPISMKFRHYNTTVLLAQLLTLHFRFPVINMLGNCKSVQNV